MRCSIHQATASALRATRNAVPGRPRTVCVRHLRYGCRAVSEGSEGTSSLQIGKEELEFALQRALKFEDYKSASKIKKQLNELDLQDPYVRLKAELDAAVKGENYQDAARLLRELKKLPPPASADKGMATPNTPEGFPGVPPNSDTVTDGIRVKVRSFYVPGQSMPSKPAYFFAYRIQIKNEGDRIMQLHSRHWKITDAAGKVTEVRGTGVVGEQPVIAPGQVYEYSSAATIQTAVGLMEGEYDFLVLARNTLEKEAVVEVKVGRFALDSTKTALP